MKEYVYTYLDDFEILYYGTIDAESESDAQNKIQKKCNNSTSVEIWNSKRQTSEGKLAWLWLDRYYLCKKTKDKLVFCAPQTFLLARIFFVFLAIVLMLTGELGWTLFILVVFTFTFVRSQKIVVRRDFIIFQKRFLREIKKKKMDISDVNRVMPKAIEFKSNNGKSQVCYFVCIEKNGQESVIYGTPNSNIASISKIANKIGGLLELPIERISDFPQRGKIKKTKQWSIVILSVALLLAVGIFFSNRLSFGLIALAIAIILLVCEFIVLLYDFLTKKKH